MRTVRVLNHKVLDTKILPGELVPNKPFQNS
jgi:hypothetical protein